jgi:TolB-like protein
MNKLLVVLSLIIVCSCTTVPKYLSFDDALGTGMQKIESDLPEGSQVAILDFKSDNENLSSYIIEEMYDKMVNFGKLVIMERSRTDTIAMEVGYQLSGEVDDNQIINIGHQLGADYVITGQITFSGEAYRLRVFAIDIEKGRRVASSSLNINQKDKQINHLITTQTTTNVQEKQTNIAGTSWTALYIDEDEQDEMFILVFGKNTVRVDEIESTVPDGLKFTLPYISTFDIGTWSQAGKSINVKFYENIENTNFTITNRVLWEFKLKIINEKTMEGTILNNGELIGNAELYKK